MTTQIKLEESFELNVVFENRNLAQARDSM